MVDTWMKTLHDSSRISIERRSNPSRRRVWISTEAEPVTKVIVSYNIQTQFFLATSEYGWLANMERFFMTKKTIAFHHGGVEDKGVCG